MFKFFKELFAGSGTTTAIPNAIDVSGNVSFTEGYGADYQRAKTDPLSKNIERDKMNYLFKAITAALQDYQTFGVPEFITTAENGGVPYPYGFAARVRYAGEVYVSLKTANSDLPSVALSWVKEVPAGIASACVGETRNLSAVLTAAATSVAFTADEITVKTATGGPAFTLTAFNQTLNVAGTGANGMDTGAAPVNGYIAVYAIYNPTTGAARTLAQSAGSLRAEIYGGASMPSGYTHSALISVLPTNGSSQIKPFRQRARVVSIPNTSVLSTGSAQASITSISLSSVVPVNAVACSGNTGITSSSGNGVANIYLYSDSAGMLGQRQQVGYIIAGATTAGAFKDLFIGTAQTIYYQSATSTAAQTFNAAITDYSF